MVGRWGFDQTNPEIECLKNSYIGLEGPYRVTYSFLYSLSFIFLQYFPLCGCIAFLACIMFIQIGYFIKAPLMLLGLSAYCIVLHYSHVSVFNAWDELHYEATQ